MYRVSRIHFWELPVANASHIHLVIEHFCLNYTGNLLEKMRKYFS